PSEGFDERRAIRRRTYRSRRHVEGEVPVIRTREAGTLRRSDAGTVVTLAGWVARRRDLGGVAFVDLRDASGIVQVVFRDEPVAGEAQRLRSEFCVRVVGEVRARPAGN